MSKGEKMNGFYMPQPSVGASRARGDTQQGATLLRELIGQAVSAGGNTQYGVQWLWWWWLVGQAIRAGHGTE